MKVRLKSGGTTVCWDAVGEFNRYSTKKIIVAAAVLQAERITGTFALDDVDAFIRSVAVVAGATVTETDTRVIIAKSP